MQRTKLIDNATQRPYIAQVVIFLIVNLFWAHVVWRAHMRKSKHRSLVHNSSQAKIPQLTVAIRVQKDVSWFQISMHDFLRGLAIV